MKKMQQGFTLIELLIVIAIIGILAAIAIPQYQNYVTRSKWQNNISQIESFKVAVAECLQHNNGDATKCATDALVTTDTGAVFPTPDGVTLATVTYTGNVFTLTGTAVVGSCVVTVTPGAGTTDVTWVYATTASTGCSKATTGFQ